MHALLDAALAYAAHNWFVFPLQPREKKPLTSHGFKDATTAPEQIEAWWKQRPDANIGIACGPSRLTVIDIDTYRGGMQEWEALHFDAPTRTARTGGGGLHLFYQTPDDLVVKSGNNKLGEGVDVKAEGGYVVAPPSVHPCGARYAWIDEREPILLTNDLIGCLVPPNERPPLTPGYELLDVDPAGTLARSHLDRLAASREGERNEQLNKCAFALGQLLGAGYLHRMAIEGMIYDAARSTGLKYAEIERTMKSGIEAGMKEPRVLSAR